MGRVVKLIVTLCHDGKFDRDTRAAEFVKRLGGAAFLLKLKAAEPRTHS